MKFVKIKIMRKISDNLYKCYLYGYNSAKRGDKLISEKEFKEKFKEKSKGIF